MQITTTIVKVCGKKDLSVSVPGRKPEKQVIPSFPEKDT